MKRTMASDGVVGQWLARISEWREKREAVRLRKKVEEIKIAGRPAVGQQRVSTKEIVEDEEEDIESIDENKPAEGERGPTVIQFHENNPAPSPKKSQDAKISHGKTNFKLPSPTLLQTAERSEKMDESELKECR